MSEALKLDDVVLELDYEQEPTISSQDLAEDHLRYLAYWRRQRVPWIRRMDLQPRCQRKAFSPCSCQAIFRSICACSWASQL